MLFSKYNKSNMILFAHRDADFKNLNIVKIDDVDTWLDVKWMIGFHRTLVVDLASVEVMTLAYLKVKTV